ncbi:MAG TPA: uracil-DNA glycosylase [Solimonas sp.]|nr:uracil-DNA glycosylase [Solimonas sp.]
MDATRRRHYLKALGIDGWALRAGEAASAPATVAPPPDPIQPPAPEDLKPYAAAADKRRGREAVAEPAVAAVLQPLTLPDNWDGLRALVADCTRCKLCQTRTQTVFGVGVRTAPLMVVGEGPGADEDAQGDPFVGRAGKLLDEMLKAIGRSRSDNVYIANVVKCRPPGNRDPEPEEAAACRPYLEQQIRLVKPKLIVALGRIAAQRLLQSDEPLARLRGPLHHYGPERTPLLITYHPAYLLRSPREKAKSWEDLKKVHRFLAGGTS